MKAYELIDAPEKWFGKDTPEDQCIGRKCAYLAIVAAYGAGRPSADVLRRFRKRLGIGSVMDWNDSHTWEEVYTAMKAADV